MEERARRIVDAAVELAEKGGFEAVRLRDVAAQAGVALGTLYRRFRSKEDLLLAALELQLGEHERRLRESAPEGDALQRVTGFFDAYTDSLCSRPNLARALVRSIGSGAPELSLKVASFHSRMERLITASLRGEPASETLGTPPGPTERRLVHSLLLVWFASLTGWASGLHPQSEIVAHTRIAAELMLEGAARVAAADEAVAGFAGGRLPEDRGRV